MTDGWIDGWTGGWMDGWMMKKGWLGDIDIEK